MRNIQSRGLFYMGCISNCNHCSTRAVHQSSNQHKETFYCNIKSLLQKKKVWNNSSMTRRKDKTKTWWISGRSSHDALSKERRQTRSQTNVVTMDVLNQPICKTKLWTFLIRSETKTVLLTKIAQTSMPQLLFPCLLNHVREGAHANTQHNINGVIPLEGYICGAAAVKLETHPRSVASLWPVARNIFPQQLFFCDQMKRNFGGADD